MIEVMKKYSKHIGIIWGLRIPPTRGAWKPESIAPIAEVARGRRFQVAWELFFPCFGHSELFLKHVVDFPYCVWAGRKKSAFRK